jgi:prepilin-type N-terminal cleavage/methylation domain-containing protein
MKRSANFAPPRRSGQAGFSLSEIVVSLAVILIISAAAIPVIVHTLRVYQLNSTASRLAGLLKFARFEAIRRNQRVSLQIVQQGANWLVWADSNGNGVLDGPEPAMVVTGSDTLIPSASAPNPSAITTTLGSGASSLPLTVLSGSNNHVSFDQRGAVYFLPGTPAIYVLYLGSATDTSFGFRAVVVLPSGVVQVWSASNAADWKRVS